MDILFHGEHAHSDIAAAIENVINLLHDRWHVQSFKDLHVSLVLVDESGFEIELIDSVTQQDLRVMNIYKHDHSYVQQRKFPQLKLV